MRYAVAGYRFTNQLLELERVSEGPSSRVLQGAEEVVTPLKWLSWWSELQEHPDKEWVEYLVRGLKYGFRIGDDQSRVTMTRKRGMAFEASHHEELIDDYLKKEESEKKMWRLSYDTLNSEVQCSPFGVIPKKGRPGKWR